MKNGISQLYQTGEMEWCKNPKGAENVVLDQKTMSNLLTHVSLSLLWFSKSLFTPWMLFLSLALESKMVSAVFLKWILHHNKSLIISLSSVINSTFEDFISLKVQTRKYHQGVTL